MCLYSHRTRTAGKFMSLRVVQPFLMAQLLRRLRLCDCVCACVWVYDRADSGVQACMSMIDSVYLPSNRVRRACACAVCVVCEARSEAENAEAVANVAAVEKNYYYYYYCYYIALLLLLPHNNSNQQQQQLNQE